MPAKRATVTVEDILERHTPEVRELALALRDIVRATVPTAEERGYGGWHAIGYTHPQAGYFGAIFPHDEVVRFCFEFGVHLDDPRGLLVGDGKQVRFMDFVPGKCIRANDLRAFLRAEIELQLQRRA